MEYYYIIVCGLVGGIFSLIGGALLLKGMQTHAWHRTKGVVESSSIKVRTLPDDNEARNTYHVELEYSYTPAGKTYRSTRISPGGLQTAYHTPEEAAKNKWSLPVGSEVTVFYNPQKLEESVLARETPSVAIVLLVIGIIFLSLGVFLLQSR